MAETWHRLAHGAYNIVYRNDDSSLILKVQIIYRDETDDYDTPSRAVRLWNEINPHLSPPAEVIASMHGTGWTCPFIHGQQASDAEISKALIDIFNATGRVVVDAPADGNFIKAPDGKIVCVDIGMALQMEAEEERALSKGSTRRKSITSLNAWRRLHNNFSSKYVGFWDKASKTFPETVHTIKALLFIKMHRPDIFDVNFLKDEPSLVATIANAYAQQDDASEKKTALTHLTRVRGAPLVTAEDLNKVRELLSSKQAIGLSHIKNSCENELQRYIRSRGFIDEQKKFMPSLLTLFFRNVALTREKVKSIQQLIADIQNATSLEDIEGTMTKAQQDEHLVQGKVTTGVASTLKKCQLIIATAKTDPFAHLCLPTAVKVK